MRNLIRAKKKSKEELKARIMYLQKEVSKLEDIICELEHRVTQLEIARKVGF